MEDGDRKKSKERERGRVRRVREGEWRRIAPMARGVDALIICVKNLHIHLQKLYKQTTKFRRDFTRVHYSNYLRITCG